MIFFKKKKEETPPPPKPALQSIVRERALTAEGWLRRQIKKGRKAK